jgi:hypothetical protein
VVLGTSVFFKGTLDVFSPLLYSQLMKDLSDMLEKENIAVSFSSKIINALMYADDVTLIAESESDLRKMLKISHDFACKWNLKFNHSKSKVLVTKTGNGISEMKKLMKPIITNT